ncbi:MAG: SRPBCC family protein [Bacteroidota bacterium]
MKFSGSIIINRPRDLVTSIFINPDCIKEYQDGFVRKELKKGTQGANGAVSQLLYQNGKHEMVLTETIISNDLPNSFEAFYHHKHMDNTLKCRFTQLENGSTEYISEVEYTRINWIMPRLFAILFPGMYKKPARKWLENFKRFVENYNN